MTEAIARSWNRLDGALAAAFHHPLARRITRNNRIFIPLCILLICGSFAAAALLQMRLDRHHAASAASQHGVMRATTLAEVAGASLDRFASIGAGFAANPAAVAALSSTVFGGLWFSAYGGYITDRFAGDGLLAGLDLHYTPAPGVDLALGIRQSDVSWVQGETGKQTTAGLNLTLGLGAPPQPSWISNQL